MVINTKRPPPLTLPTFMPCVCYPQVAKLRDLSVGVTLGSGLLLACCSAPKRKDSFQPEELRESITLRPFLFGVSSLPPAGPGITF